MWELVKAFKKYRSFPVKTSQLTGECGVCLILLPANTILAFSPLKNCVKFCVALVPSFTFFFMFHLILPEVAKVLEFPAVSICNQAKFKLSAIENLSDEDFNNMNNYTQYFVTQVRSDALVLQN